MATKEFMVWIKYYLIVIVVIAVISIGCYLPSHYKIAQVFDEYLFYFECFAVGCGYIHVFAWCLKCIFSKE